jgi:hypothetical protein
LRIFWLCEILNFVDKIEIEVAPVFKKQLRNCAWKEDFNHKVFVNLTRDEKKKVRRFALQWFYPERKSLTYVLGSLLRRSHFGAGCDGEERNLSVSLLKPQSVTLRDNEL